MEQHNQDVGAVSDGYHTLSELYEHRYVLFVVLCKYTRDLAWRSRLHHDGSMYAGYFILGLYTEPGRQITYHLPMRFWDQTRGIQELDRAPEFDGHSSDDVLARLKMLDTTSRV